MDEGEGETLELKQTTTIIIRYTNLIPVVEHRARRGKEEDETLSLSQHLKSPLVSPSPNSCLLLYLPKPLLLLAPLCGDLLEFLPALLALLRQLVDIAATTSRAPLRILRLLVLGVRLCTWIVAVHLHTRQTPPLQLLRRQRPRGGHSFRCGLELLRPVRENNALHSPVITRLCIATEVAHSLQEPQRRHEEEQQAATANTTSNTPATVPLDFRLGPHAPHLPKWCMVEYVVQPSG